MSKIKEIVVRPLLGITTFFVCAFLIFIGLSLAGFSGILRRKAAINK